MGKIGSILVIAVLAAIVVFVGYNYSEQITGKAVETAEECSDSDGGMDYYLNGTISPLRGVNADYCAQRKYMIPSGNKIGDLIEHYCNDGVADRIAYTCPNGCHNGECIPPLDKVLFLELVETDDEIFVPCTDSDEGKYPRVRGTISGSTIDPDTAEDECMLMGGKSVLAETYCYNNERGAVEYYDCYDERKSCENGVCVALEPVTESKDLRYHYSVISDDVITEEPGCTFGGKGNYQPWAEGYVNILAGLTPTKDSYTRYIGTIMREHCDYSVWNIKWEFYCDKHGYAHIAKIKCKNGCQLGVCERDG